MRLKLSGMGGLKKGSGGVRLWRYIQTQHDKTLEARAETAFNVCVWVQVLTLLSCPLHSSIETLSLKT